MHLWILPDTALAFRKVNSQGKDPQLLMLSARLLGRPEGRNWKWPPTGKQGKR